MTRLGPLLPGDDEPPTRTAARRAAVLAALRSDPGLRLEELLVACDLEMTKLAPLLWRMEEDGLVVHEGRRWFVRSDD